MPNINRIITLTAQGSNSGPLYDIYYSNDCVNYTLCIDGDNRSLPSVGSTAIVTLPDTAICIKLVNLSEGCLLNEVVQYIGGITTTSTTTIGPPTTTSTTTAGPTTTTTTFSSNPCICTEVNITSEGGEVQTFNCYGVNENYVYLTAGTRYLCAAEIGGLLQAEIVSGTGTVTPVGNCKTGPCPPATTTTTAASTTTTTAGPTTTTTTYITTYEVEPCGGGSGPFIVTRASGDIPAGIGQAYKISGNTPAGFNGTTCWEILDIDPVGTIDYANLAFGSSSINCDTCNGVTTTTTTTAAPTTTTTTTQCPCVETVTLNVTEAGNVQFNDCFGVTRLTSVGTGTQTLDYTADGCININTLSGTAMFTIDAYGPCCTPTSTTTTTSTTTSTTSTTTTTEAPTYYEVELCGGGLGPWIVTRGSGDIPAGIGQAFKISGNTPDGFNGTNCWVILDNSATGPADYTNLAFGTSYINCETCNPPITTTTTTAAPTTTTTIAPTTTTTTADPYDYYEADEYSCDPCTFQQSNVRVAFPAGTSIVTANRYYRPAAFTGFVYKNFTSVSPGISIIMTAAGNSTNCNTACGVTTTSTTTTTAAPTTTTTSTTTEAPTFYQVELCGGGIGPYIITRGSGDIPAGIGQAFKISGNSGAGFNGTNCWEILDNAATGPADYTNLAFGTSFSNCSACNPTTTTTTAAPTTTTTTAAPTCIEYRIENNTETSIGISYYDCNGTYVSDNLGSGNQLTFCANTGYGAIETGGGTLFTIGSCTPTTTTTSTTTTSAGTLFYISNSSLDIIITDVKVNGVSVYGATGSGFPVYTGENINAYSNQIGVYDVDIYYSNAITGQHIEGYDSDLNFYCNATVGIGSNTTQFGGATIGAGTFQIYALDGSC